jgi:excinuclease UvrABC nuclease subunit
MTIRCFLVQPEKSRQYITRIIINMETFKLTDDFYKHIPYTSGVYAIRNDLNNHMYIGSTTNLRRRLRTHIGYLKNDKHANERLQCDFNKIGIDKFSYIILEHCDENIDTLHYLENKYI